MAHDGVGATAAGYASGLGPGGRATRRTSSFGHLAEAIEETGRGAMVVGADEGRESEGDPPTKANGAPPLGSSGVTLASIDGARYRQVLGHFATGVTVVTTVHEDAPAGLCVNSFTSVSLDPPLVGFCVSRHSSTWAVIRKAGRFCVNVLDEDQEELSRRFATRGADRFAGLGWRPTSSGSPLLGGVLAWVDCTLEAEHDGGDHVVVIGRVQGLDVAEGGRPLIFYRGGYGRFER